MRTVTFEKSKAVHSGICRDRWWEFRLGHEQGCEVMERLGAHLAEVV